MTKQEAIELLEATRQKIVSQGRMFARGFEPLEPVNERQYANLQEEERKLEQLLANGGMDEASHTKPETA